MCGDLPPLAPRGSRGSVTAWLLALIVLAGVAFAVWYFALRKPDADSAALAARVMPAEVDVIGGADLARLVADPSVREQLGQAGVDLARLDAELQRADVALADLRALAFGARMADDAARPALSDALVAVHAATDAKAAVGAFKVLLTALPEPFARLARDGRVEALDGGIVLAGSGELLDKALAVARGAGTPLGDKAGLDDVRDAVDDGAMAWVASPLPESVTARVPAMARGMLGAMPSHVAFAGSLGESTELRAAVHMPGGDGAQIAKNLEMALPIAKRFLPSGLTPLIEKLQLSGRGQNVIATLILSRAELSELVLR